MNCGAADTAALAAAEAEIVAHLNTEHAAPAALGELLIGRAGDGWRMTGIDAEGLDLRRDGRWRAGGSISPRPGAPRRSPRRDVSLVNEARRKG